MEFRARFGEDGRPRCFFAPGRVNLIGAHLDYNGGMVLPVSVDRGVFLMVAARGGDDVTLASLDRPNTSVTRLGPQSHEPAGHWANYARGVLHSFPEIPAESRSGLDMMFAGNLPIGSGLSSSAAIQVVTAVALDAMFDVGLEPVELARIAFRSETQFVGVRCGIMDPFASALCRHGHAILLDCRNETFRQLPIPASQVELIMLDTRKPRSLVASEFNLRVEQCRAAFNALQRLLPGRSCLAEYKPADLAAVVRQLPDVEYRRARHVVDEMLRVADAAVALEAGDLEAFGMLVTRSHGSSRDNYQVSCPELDFMVEQAVSQDGVFGARLTGAGFGGCAMALARPGSFEELATPILAGYEERFGLRAEISLLRPGGGAMELTQLLAS
jgi:galactokinase